MTKLTPTFEPKTIIVEPSRLQSGLWGFEEGDISRSYSADVYSEKRTIRQSFTHGSQLYVAMSVHGHSKSLQAKAYPLIHESYRNDILDEFNKSGQNSRYYTGNTVSFSRQKCVLGLPVIFKQRPYTNEEYIDLLRRMYAYGGLFAAEAGSYKNFLMTQIDQEEQNLFNSGILHELTFARANELETQVNLREWIELLSSYPTFHEQLSLL